MTVKLSDLFAMSPADRQATMWALLWEAYRLTAEARRVEHDPYRKA